jgi:hypothetical protein
MIQPLRVALLLMKAAETRLKAETMHHGEAQQMMLKIARGYDALLGYAATLALADEALKAPPSLTPSTEFPPWPYIPSTH